MAIKVTMLEYADARFILERNAKGEGQLAEVAKKVLADRELFDKYLVMRRQRFNKKVQN